jgi:hypothetical protein
LAAWPVLAGTQDYNGRWDITALTQLRPRAWWVELTGVGTPQAAGKFVSAYGGDMNTIDKIEVVTRRALAAGLLCRPCGPYFSG